MNRQERKYDRISYSNMSPKDVIYTIPPEPVVNINEERTKRFGEYREQEKYFRALEWIHKKPEIRRKVVNDSVHDLDKGIDKRISNLKKGLGQAPNGLGIMGWLWGVGIKSEMYGHALLAKITRDNDSLSVLGQRDVYPGLYEEHALKYFERENPNWRPETIEGLQTRYTYLKAEIEKRVRDYGEGNFYGGLKEESDRVALSYRIKEYELMSRAGFGIEK